MELEALEDSETQENFRVRIGSDVLVANDEFDHNWIVRVTELFEDRDDDEVDAPNISRRGVLMQCVLVCPGAGSFQRAMVLSNRGHSGDGHSKRRNFGASTR